MRDPFEDEESEKSVDRNPVSLLTATNDEATSCRLSAVRVGLLEDGYVRHFIGSHAACSQKDPIINRGTFIRIKSIDKILTDLKPDQVISLGAGFDTRPFNWPQIRWVEVDFEEVISRKRHIIQSHNLGHENHVMISADLEVCDFSTRTLPLIQASLSKQDGFRTAVLAECCLMYLSEGAFREVLSCLADKLPASATLIIFDPLFLGDSFGRTMCLNLQKRGLCTQTFQKYPDEAAYRQRLSQCRWKVESFQSMKSLGDQPEYRQFLSQRAALDEYEEWDLMAKHYFILTANPIKQ